MASKKYMQTLSLVGKLEVEEKVALHKLLGSMLGASRAATDVDFHTVGHSRAIVGQLLKFMRSAGLSDEDVTLAAIDRILTRKVGKGAVSKCEALWAFVSGQTEDRLRRESLLQLGFRLHYDELRTWMDVVTVDQMLQFLERIPACFDAQFPGYASQRLLEKLVSMKRR